MRILLLGDASNFHPLLAKGLKGLGHYVTIASNGSGWMDTYRDIDLSRKPGKLGGALLWAKVNTLLANHFKGYDVVQVAGVGFLEQRPHRIRRFFDFLRRYNRKVFLCDVGTDKIFIDMCKDPKTMMPYSEFQYPFMDPTVEQWHRKPISDLCDYIYSHADGISTVLYEYQLGAEHGLERLFPKVVNTTFSTESKSDLSSKSDSLSLSSCPSSSKSVQSKFPESKPQVRYCGLPIDVDSIQPVDLASRQGPIKIFLGRHSRRKEEKGTDFLEQLAHEIVRRRPGDFVLDIVEDLPYQEYVQRLRDADIVLDQLYSPTPALNALLAMAYGQVVVSGGEEDFYNFIGEDELRPVINAVPGKLEQTIEKILSIENRQQLALIGQQSRQFVLKHHNVNRIAQNYVEFWKEHLR